MKKKILYSILFVLVIFLVGCQKEDKDEIKRIENLINNPNANVNKIDPNMRLGFLWFYIPKDEYTYRPDLRGLAYDEEEKKVYIKGDYDNNPSDVISIVVYSINNGKGVKQYTDEINANFTQKDVFYTMKNNENIIEIYARENYVIGNDTNYAYMLDKAGTIYVVNIKGPNAKSSEISKLARDIHSSLLFK